MNEWAKRLRKQTTVQLSQDRQLATKSSLLHPDTNIFFRSVERGPLSSACPFQFWNRQFFLRNRFF
jgi:hypothetical protein